MFSWQFPFFWDNVLNSKIAHWYLETGFSDLIVPENMDAGHPPFFSMYIAAVWAVIGKSLAAAHAAMLPFLLGTVWAWWRICRAVLPESYAGWAMLILVVEPTYLAQSSMVSPDVALVCCFLLGVVAVLENKRWLLAVATVVMCAVTFRGILMVPGLFLLQWAWDSNRWNVRRTISMVPSYLPAAVFAGAWLLYHWQVQGWLFTPPPETYGGHREVMGLSGMLRNVGIAGWRFLDYGRVFLFVFLAVAVVWKGKMLVRDKRMRRAGALLLVPSLWLLLLLVPFSNPIGHRYFAVGFLALGLVVLWVVDLLEKSWRRWLVPGLLGLGLLGGHFWVYPDHIAQGWDATLAHTRFFPLQNQLNNELGNLISPEKRICSDFPLLADPATVTLEPHQRPHIFPKDDQGWENCDCMVATNISNGFSDEEWTELKNGKVWSLVRSWENGPVFIKVLQRK